MKHMVIFLLASLILFASCGTSQKDIDAAKQDLLQGTSSSQTLSQNTNSGVTQSSLETKDMEKSIEVIEFGQDSFLKIDELNIEDFLDGEAEISGETLTNVEKIEVDFSNADSDFPKDSYTLQTFKIGDTRFTYRASSGFKVLDFWENIYTFRAFSGTQTSETQVIVRLPSENGVSSEEKWFSETQLIGGENNTLLLNLPTSSKYGEPVRLWESSFTYSGIKGFEVTKELIPSVSCENLAQYLSETQSSWFYWNTCRDIVKEKGIKFNLIRLDGEKYIYERHYIDFEHGLSGSYEIETGIWVTKDTIQIKNTELKDQVFPAIEIVDDLMKDIVNS